jgi:hypothetical protein
LKSTPTSGSKPKDGALMVVYVPHVASERRTVVQITLAAAEPTKPLLKWVTCAVAPLPSSVVVSGAKSVWLPAAVQ